jgi:hypothetical protein
VTSQPAGLAKGDKRAAGKAKARTARPDAQQRERSRTQPLPPGVFLGRLNNKVAAWWIDDGRLAVQTERDGPWEQLDVTAAGRGGWLWTRAKLTLADGSRRRVCVYRAGERGPVEVGEPDSGDSFGVGSLGNDPISAVIGLVLVVVYLIALPFVTVSLVRHSRAAGRFLMALAQARGDAHAG